MQLTKETLLSLYQQRLTSFPEYGNTAQTLIIIYIARALLKGDVHFAYKEIIIQLGSLLTQNDVDITDSKLQELYNNSWTTDDTATVDALCVSKDGNILLLYIIEILIPFSREPQSHKRINMLLKAIAYMDAFIKQYLI
jgi:hypothetical protein